MDINYTDRDLNEETTLQLKQTLNRLIETLIKPEHLKRDLFFAVLLYAMKQSDFILIKKLGKPTTIQDNILEERIRDDVYEAMFVLTEFEATAVKLIACFLQDVVLTIATIPQIKEATYSTCFTTNRYVLTSNIGIPMDFANLNELFFCFKEKIVMPLKSSILNHHRFSSGSLSGLPDDILHQILLSLPLRDVLNLSETCKRIYKVTIEESLWCRLYRRDYSNECKSGEKSWHDMYRDIYVMKQAEKFKLARNVGAETFEEFGELADYIRRVDSRWEVIL
ncbi:uncharacterized protein LOC115449112 [Manduca sexta]|uniref:uncharacterized protein LOC115449112 n=1 Tax=Manduca sexta TaxID=7130 RepID=UPI001182303B|nr:uncharacterized protein LOC115449112 [Manduca sexta]